MQHLYKILVSYYFNFIKRKVIIISIQFSIAGAIPVGIAVARQRLQEHNAVGSVVHQQKDVNRFGIGLTDMGEFLFVFFFNIFTRDLIPENMYMASFCVHSPFFFFFLVSSKEKRFFLRANR